MLITPSSLRSRLHASENSHLWGVPGVCPVFHGTRSLPVSGPKKRLFVWTGPPMAHRIREMATPITPKSVLIVDDSPEFSLILKRLLTAVLGSAEITIIDNTQQALSHLQASVAPFDFLFIDFHFPTGMNGADLLLKLKEEGLLGKDMIVFIMSSDPTAQALDSVIKAGASGVITKPFDRNALSEQVQRAARERDDSSGGFSV